MSYETARSHDIGPDGKDQACHKNDEALQNVTLELDEKSLRRLFTSVGLAKRDGNFPIVDVIERSALYDEIYEENSNENIKAQLAYLAQICPEFGTCQNSTMDILKSVSFNNKHLHFKRCLTNRVYDREDTEKRPVLYVYTEDYESRKKFYIADKNEGAFTEFSLEEFEKRFECYDMDLEKRNRN